MFVSRGERFSGTSKAYLRKGTLLGAEKFLELLRCTAVSDVARCLMDTPYAKLMPNDVSNFRRDEFEFMLSLSEADEAGAFFSCLGLERSRFLKLWLEEIDISLIKNRIWEVASGKKNVIPAESEKKFDSLGLSLIDRRKLLAAGDLPEILASIKNEELVMYIEEAVKRYSGTSSSVVVGLAIDFFQNDRIFKAAKCFSGIERDGILSIIGVRADVLNITWIYRARRFFNMSDEMALSITLPTRYQVQFETLKKMAGMPFDQMHELFYGTKYALLLPSSQSPSDGSIAKNMRKILRENALRVIMSGGTGAHVVLAYLALKTIEIADIKVIIETVRYDYDRNAAEKLLAYPLAEGR